MKKSKYSRRTKEVTFQELQPKFIAYLKKYAEFYSFNSKDLEISHCFETTNDFRGLFGQKKTYHINICFSEKYLFWGHIHSKKETGVAAVKWDEIFEAWDWEKTASGRIYEDSGIEIYGTIYLKSQRSRWLIGLGNDEAGNKVKQLIAERISDKYRGR